MTPGRCFLAAAVLLLLGAAAVPAGLAAYAIASSSREPYAVAIGVRAVFLLFVAIAGPIILTIAGLVTLFFGRDRDA